MPTPFIQLLLTRRRSQPGGLAKSDPPAFFFLGTQLVRGDLQLSHLVGKGQGSTIAECLSPSVCTPHQILYNQALNFIVELCLCQKTVLHHCATV